MDNSNPSQPVLDEYYRQLELLIRHGGTTAERILSFDKLRIAANERLMFLASGMLTLTFSGVWGLASRTGFHFERPATTLLLWAWKLLILSVLCCIGANSREQQAASAHDSDLLALELNSRNVLLAVLGSKLEPPVTPVSKQQRITQKGGPQETLARWLGFAARLSILIAFVLLYFFAKSTLARF